MFDWIKMLIGQSTCRGCKYRRFGGLYCGKRFGRGKQHYPASAWQRYGCWYFMEERPILKEAQLPYDEGGAK